jgi:hypothetical protein
MAGPAGLAGFIKQFEIFAQSAPPFSRENSCRDLMVSAIREPR